MNSSLPFSKPFPIIVAEKCLSALPIIMIVIGVTGNSISFFIFRFNKSMNQLSSMVYLSFIVVLNTFSLFVWNLNDFTSPNFRISLEFLSTAHCRILVFIQFFTLQASSFLLSIVSIDRCVQVMSVPGSLASKLPFGHLKPAYVWSIGLTILFALINLHVLIFNGYYSEPRILNQTSTIYFNGSLVRNYTEIVRIENPVIKCYSYSPSFTLDPFYEYVHLTISSLIPFIIMIISNTILIRKVISAKKSKSLASAQNNGVKGKRNRLTSSLLTLTFTFIILVMPKAIFWAFINQNVKGKPYRRIIIQTTNFLLFMNQSMTFFICFFTYQKFREIVLDYYKILKQFLLCCKNTMNQKSKSQKYLENKSVTKITLTDRT
jgi:hypothetical protein